jgi:hypothetical protein
MKPIALSPESKLIGLNVYRTRYDFQNGAESDCTNGGASAKANTVYIPHPEGYMRVKDVHPSLIFTPEQRGLNYWALKPAFPLDKDDSRVIGPMDGGNLATTCDSRGGGLVYHIHDRFETAADYQAMSRD